MTLYWLLFLFPAMVAILNVQADLRQAKAAIPWTIAWLTLVAVIGLRFEVGGDWGNYLNNLDTVIGPFSEVFFRGDVGYEILSWIGVEVGGGIYFVNIACAIMFSTGLVAFARSQPRPWVALVVAIPYLVIVVAMGYTRQGAAIGLMMLGLNALARRRTFMFVFLMLIAAAMHKSAIVMLPLAILAVPKRRIWNAVWGGITIIVAYRVLVADSVDDLFANYIETAYSSEGATVRIAMTAIPAAVLLLERRRLQVPTAERHLWLLIAMLSVGAAVWLPFAASSTAVDRLSLYCIPLQIYVFARLPELLGPKSSEQSIVVAIVVYYGIVQFVWLNFAIHANSWIPYRWAPLV
jgi:EpsG family